MFSLRRAPCGGTRRYSSRGSGCRPGNPLTSHEPLLDRNIRPSLHRLNSIYGFNIAVNGRSARNTPEPTIVSLINSRSSTVAGYGNLAEWIYVASGCKEYNGETCNGRHPYSFRAGAVSEPG